MKPMSKEQACHYLPFIIVGFWGVWFAVGALTNLFDLVYQIGLLGIEWRYRSNNFSLMAQIFNNFGSLSWFVYVAFILNLIAQIVIAYFFMVSSYLIIKKKEHAAQVYSGFVFSIALWCVFLIFEEIFIAYGLESVHFRLLIAELLSLLFIRNITQS